jgi:sugar fermentation stimulation protein A
MKILLKIGNYEKGVIIERLNRFVVKARVKNKYILAHLNNTGRLEDFIKKGRIGLFLPINADYADSTQTVRTKLKFRLSMIKESKNIYSIIDTSLQMKCFEIALEKGYISWLKGAKILKRNYRINHSLIDYLIEHKNKKYLLEIKSAVMKYKNFAMYPDCPSIRGQKHIKELIDIQTLQTERRLGRQISKHNAGFTQTNANKNTNYSRIKNELDTNNKTQINHELTNTNESRIERINHELDNKEFETNSLPFVNNSRNNIRDKFVDKNKEYQRLSALYQYKSMVLFIAGMKNISAFSPNKNADPKIYELLKIAKNKGVKIKAIQIYFNEKRKSVILKNDNLPVIL